MEGEVSYTSYSILFLTRIQIQANATKFPIIARIARDYLAVPGAIVPVERMFSRSRHLCKDTRAPLRAKTITEVMCMREWLQTGVMDLESI